jgi:hypothetical protein
MALLFNKIQQTAQTHVLIIAVGGYPYLSGGDHERAQTFDGAQLLGQLTSPQVSAEAFYETLMDLHHNQSWIKPLGSIDVLVSPAPGGKRVFNGQQPDRPTIANISLAYFNWKQRCDTNPDNVAVFFFCGHGLDKAEHYLLAEDFGFIPGNPWTGAFAFDLTRRAFFSCRASTQLFFVDACRQVTTDMLQTEIPTTPIEPPNLLSRDCQFNLTQKAAAANEMAYGKKSEPSFYTKALIGALKGNAANNETGEWRIGTGTLSSKMNSFLQNESPLEGYPQRCISTTSNVTDILRFAAPPEVALRVTCNPEAALAKAELFCIDPATDTGPTRPPAIEPWQLNVRAGIYKIGARFNEPIYRHTPVYTLLMPPRVSQSLNCVP